MPLYHTDGSDTYQKIKIPREEERVKMHVSILVNGETRIVFATEDRLANSPYYELILDKKNNNSEYLMPELWSHNRKKSKLIESYVDQVSALFKR